jgi:hypothetical protein
MSSSFVTSLRAGSTIRVGTGSGTPMLIRAQLLDAWDAVRVETWPTTTAREIKEAALLTLDPAADAPADYVLKLGGFEVLDEDVGLESLGVVSGSILSIGYRYRRPVR